MNHLWLLYGVGNVISGRLGTYVLISQFLINFVRAKNLKELKILSHFSEITFYVFSKNMGGKNVYFLRSLVFTNKSK